MKGGPTGRLGCQSPQIGKSGSVMSSGSSMVQALALSEIIR